ncbi:MAG TPA: glycosyltransferase family 87 protein [Caulobacteraceae bacterium]|nr:glycosyltransferase family 87 protein [Caulobacteraceae bacterium]
MSWAKAWGWLRVVVLAAGVLYLAAQAWDHVNAILAYQPLGIDFMPMWAAAREVFPHPGRIYDFTALTRFEHPLMEHFRGLRPFVYPPSALLAFLPFSALRFEVANLAWTALGLVAILWTMFGRLGSPRVLALLAMALTPPSVLVLVTGQVTFIVAALTVAGLYCLRTRPVSAGVLFGLAGALKPQALVLLPLALLATREWRALAAAAATLGVAVAVSALVFGVGAWFEWVAAVPRFQRMVMDARALERGMITPTALGHTLKLDPGALDTWRLVFGVGAAVMAWMVFRSTSDPARRIAALLGGGLFVTPYAMHYDAALLAPAAALILTHRTRPGAWILAVAAGAVLCCAAIPHWGAAAVIAFTLWTALTPETLLMGKTARGDGDPRPHSIADLRTKPRPGDPGGLADRELGPA